MKRKIYSPEHIEFKELVEQFLRKEVAPHYEQWQKDRIIPKKFWTNAGEWGLLCPQAPKEFGGNQVDFLYSSIIIDRIYYYGFSSIFIPLHNDLAFPYLLNLGTSEAKEEWIRSCIAGRTVLALAMTEPNAGSDLAAMQTSAKKEGDHYVLNGAKTFISNGQTADLFIVAAKTNAELGAKGLGLFLVDAKKKGFSRGGHPRQNRTTRPRHLGTLF